MSEAAVPRLAILCFVPEFGHAGPLLRIGREARADGFEVRCFLADEVGPLGGRFSLDVETIGAVRPEGATSLLDRMIDRARSIGRARAARAYADGYMVPLMLSLAERSEELGGRVAAWRPDLVLSDDHALQWLYRAVAPRAPHVRHVASGSHFECQPSAVRRSGLPVTAASWLRDRRETFLEWLEPRLQRWLRRREWEEARRARARIGAARSRLAAAGTHGPRIRIATGLGPLERTHLGGVLEPCPSIEFFGALEPSTGAAVPPDIEAWLAASERPVALVSLGSVIRADRGATDAIRTGLTRAGFRVLIVGRSGSGRAAGPDPDRRTGAAGDRADVRTTGFVPQAELLADPRIRLFVTHAGASAVQEGVWTAKPMLCLPLVSDQFYNSSVVERLGVGRSVRAGRGAARRVEHLARALVEDPSVQAGVQARAAELRALEGGRRVVERLRSLAEIAPRASP